MTTDDTLHTLPDAPDLAGPEAGWPASRHAALLARVRDAGLGLTLHAGEADAAVAEEVAAGALA